MKFPVRKDYLNCGKFKDSGCDKRFIAEATYEQKTQIGIFFRLTRSGDSKNDNGRQRVEVTKQASEYILQNNFLCANLSKKTAISNKISQPFFPLSENVSSVKQNT